MITPLNCLIFVAFMATTTLLANRFAGRAKSSRGFFQASADGGLPWWVVSLSIVSGNTSAVTFLAVPTAVFISGGNLTYGLMVAGFGLGAIALALVFTKSFFEETRANTVYDYISLRVNPQAGAFSLVLGYLVGILGNSLRLLATALVLSVVAEISLASALIVLTVLAAVWSSVAGIRTVIWTDVILYTVFTIGAIFSAVWIFYRLPLDLGSAWAQLDANSKLLLIDLSTDPAKGYTLWTALFGATAMQFASAIQQGNFQRIRSCRNDRDSRRAFIWAAVFSITPFFMLIVGLGLWLHYQLNPLSADMLSLLAKEPDRIFPYFIVTELPDGISGLMITAIMAAGLSNSVLTEMADMTVTNVYRPYFKPAADEAHYLRASRIALCLWGVLFAGAAYAVSHFQEAGILQLAFKLPGYVAGLGLGTMILARLERRPSAGLYFTGAALSVAAVFALGAAGVNYWWWYLGGAFPLLLVAYARPRTTPSV